MDYEIIHIKAKDISLSLEIPVFIKTDGDFCAKKRNEMKSLVDSILENELFRQMRLTL